LPPRCKTSWRTRWGARCSDAAQRGRGAVDTAAL
jgi:hypothetical protein